MSKRIAQLKKEKKPILNKNRWTHNVDIARDLFEEVQEKHDGYLQRSQVVRPYLFGGPPIDSWKNRHDERSLTFWSNDFAYKKPYSELSNQSEYLAFGERAIHKFFDYIEIDSELKRPLVKFARQLSILKYQSQGVIMKYFHRVTPKSIDEKFNVSNIVNIDFYKGRIPVEWIYSTPSNSIMAKTLGNTKKTAGVEYECPVCRSSFQYERWIYWLKWPKFKSNLCSNPNCSNSHPMAGISGY